MTIIQINATENFNEDRNPSLTRLQKATPGAKAHHTAYRSLRSLHPFLHSSPSYTTTKTVCFTILFNRPNRHPKSAHSRGACTPHAIHVPWTHQTQHPMLHLDRFSRFCTARGRESLYFAVCVKTRLTRDEKN